MNTAIAFLPEVADGLVVVDRADDNWYLVRIGRARKTKRVWLYRGEAEQLIDKLTEAIRS